MKLQSVSLQGLGQDCVGGEAFPDVVVGSECLLGFRVASTSAEEQCEQHYWTIQLRDKIQMMQVEEERTALQAQIADAVHQSLAMHQPANAAFLAERLLGLRDSEDNRGVLAECYFAQNKHYKAMHLLKECRSDGNKYRLGLACFKSNKLKDAQRALLDGNLGGNSKIENVPGGAFGFNLLGQIYEKQQRYIEAKDSYLRALELNPTLWTAFQKLGKFIEAKSGDAMHVSTIFNEKAESKTKKGRKPGVGKEVVAFLHRLALPYQKMCTFECAQAIEEFKKLPEGQYKSGWVLSCIGRCFMEVVKYQQADKYYNEAHKLEPYRLEGLEYYSSCLWQLKKPTQLCYLAHSALDKSLYAPETWIMIGNCFSLLKEHENAIRFFGRAIQLAPQNPYAQSLCGLQYLNNEDFSKAKKCFETALNLDIRHYNAWWGLGSIYFKQEKYNEAVEHFAKAISINPRNPVLYSFLGMTLTSKREYAEALKYFEKSEALDPRNGLNRYQKANTLVKLKRFDQALEELFRLQEMMPREAPIPTLMGKIYKKLGQVEKAHQQFSKALDLESKDTQKIKGLIDSLHAQDGFEVSEDLD